METEKEMEREMEKEMEKGDGSSSPSATLFNRPREHFNTFLQKTTFI